MNGIQTSSSYGKTISFSFSLPNLLLYDESPDQEDLEEKNMISQLLFHEVIPLYDESYSEKNVLIKAEEETIEGKL